MTDPVSAPKLSDASILTDEALTTHATSEECTLEAYDARTQDLVRDYEGLQASSLAKIYERWLVKGSTVLELGCGSGRDARMLARQGMRVLATDGSPVMLREAQGLAINEGFDKDSDALRFVRLALPLDAENAAGVNAVINEGKDSPSEILPFTAPFDAVLAVGVLQHLTDEALARTVSFLEAALMDSGTLIVSVPIDHPGDAARSVYRREYFNRPATFYAALFERYGLTQVQSRSNTQAGAAGRTCIWCTLVFLKTHSRRRATTNIRGLLESDAKLSTYKLALLRALCDINIQNPGRVRYAGGPSNGFPVETIALPFELLIERVVEYYWQIFRHADKRAPASQIVRSRSLAFAGELETVMNDYGRDWFLFRKDFYNGTLAKDPVRSDHLLDLFKCMAETLRKGPVYFAGNSLGNTAAAGKSNRLFSTSRTRPLTGGATPRSLSDRYGDLYMPADIWRELNFSAPFVADSVLLHWAELSERFSQLAGLTLTAGEILQDMLPACDIRDVQLASQFYKARIQSGTEHCVWTNEPLAVNTLAVDHMLPWSRLHSNDLWNLVPAWNKANSLKSDLIPSKALLLASRSRIVGVWKDLEASSLGALFRAQAENSLLKTSLPASGWETPLFNAVLVSADMAARQFGAARWSGYPGRP